MLGKLNMDEFAMGSSNETSHYGAVINPLARRRLGPAARSGRLLRRFGRCRLAHLCAGATATDTGGSIRQPAASHRHVGIKPTYGRCSRWGTVAFASSLDQAGPIARDVRDACPPEVDGLGRCGAYLGRSAGSRLRSRARQSLKSMKIGIPNEYRVASCTGRNRNALAAGHRPG